MTFLFLFSIHVYEKDNLKAKLDEGTFYTEVTHAVTIYITICLHIYKLCQDRWSLSNAVANLEHS